MCESTAVQEDHQQLVGQSGCLDFGLPLYLQLILTRRGSLSNHRTYRLMTAEVRTEDVFRGCRHWGMNIIKRRLRRTEFWTCSSVWKQGELLNVETLRNICNEFTWFLIHSINSPFVLQKHVGYRVPGIEPGIETCWNLKPFVLIQRHMWQIPSYNTTIWDRCAKQKWLRSLFWQNHIVVFVPRVKQKQKVNILHIMINLSLQLYWMSAGGLNALII